MFTIQASLSGIQNECSLIIPSHPLFCRLVCIKLDPVTNLVHDFEHIPSGWGMESPYTTPCSQSRGNWESLLLPWQRHSMKAAGDKWSHFMENIYPGKLPDSHQDFCKQEINCWDNCWDFRLHLLAYQGIDYLLFSVLNKVYVYFPETQVEKTILTGKFKMFPQKK